MNLNLNNIITTLKQIAVLVSVVGATIVTLKVLGVHIPLSGSILDWSAVTVATALASK
jgi:hypothetical protein